MSDPVSVHFSTVNTQTDGSQVHPDVAVLTDGTYVVVWEDADPGIDVIRFQRYDANGAKLGGEVTLPNTAVPGTAASASIAALDDGGFIITHETVTDQQVWARYDSPSATVAVAEGVFSTDKASFDGASDILQAPDGTLWVVWDDDVPGTNGMRLDRWTPNPDGTLTFLGSVDGQTGADPSLTVLASGQVALVYNTSATIRYSVYNADGTVALAETTFSVPNGTAGFNTARVQVTGLDNGALMLSWTARDATFPAHEEEVFGQIFVPDTFTAYDDPFIISAATTGSQYYHRIVTLDDGGFVALYMDNFEGNSISSGVGITAQRFDGLGNPIGGHVHVSGVDVNLFSTTEGGPMAAELLDDGRIVLVFNGEYDGGDEIVQVILDLRNPVGEGFVLGDRVAGDLLTGTGYNEAFDGRGGDDTILASHGHDRVMGGDDEDLLYGGVGFDTLDGGDGNDTMYGQNDADSIIGGSGLDRIFGGDGADTVQAGTGNDYVRGEAGNDDLYGGTGDDTLEGGDGGDLLLGGDGRDSLEGGAGSDTVYGDEGNDTIWGEDGDDFLDGGVGFDSIEGGIGNDTLDGGDDADTLKAGDGNDLIFGVDGNDQLFGGTGNDTLEGGVGDDTLYGQNDNDSILGGEGLDRIFAGTGNDTVRGGSQNDFVRGEDGNDQLFGENGNDTLEGSDGNDTLYGQAGDDSILGGDGLDRIFAGSENDTVRSDGGDDFVRGEDGNDQLFGGNGEDTLDGGSGNDTIYGQNDDDLILGGSGLDRIFAGSGDDEIEGGGENDFVRGEAGDDFLGGGNDNDTLDGGSGNDSIYGDGGDDLLTGGADADTFVFFVGMGEDEITDFTLDTDQLFIGDTLAGSATTGAQIVADYGQIIGGNAVLLFDLDNSIVISSLSSLTGLADDIFVI